MTDDLRARSHEGRNDPEGDSVASEPETTTGSVDVGDAPGDLVHDRSPDFDGDVSDARPHHGAHVHGSDPSLDPAAETAEPSAGARVARRVVRRPVEWWQRPWDQRRAIEVGITVAAITATTVVMMLVVHFNPFSPGRDLIFDATTPTGGDMGAHVWAPAFLRDNFLGNLQISGWSMDWYGGLPLYRFYMVIPALAIVALDVVLPYGIAFKIVAMSGLVTFPAACWAFGRLAGFRHPVPELFAFSGTAFLLDESFEIYGGNVKSTMAGEYSFSIALTLAVLGLGFLASALRTGRHRVSAAVTLSLACVSHGIVLIFVAVAATLMSIVWLVQTAIEDRSFGARTTRRLVVATTTGVTTLLLSAWWVGPFLLGHEFMTDMKYGFRPNSATDSFWDMYFPLTQPLDIAIMALAVVGFVACVLRRRTAGIALGFICAAFFWLVWNTRDSLPGIGLLWNPRLLPFLYLTRYLLMVIGAYELIRWVVNAARDRVASADLPPVASATGAGVIALAMLTVFGWMYEVLPGGGRVVEVEATDDSAAQTTYAWGPFRKPLPDGSDNYRSRAVADGWTRYNWQGYEGRTAYPAYHHVVTTMEDIGAERGCGRAMWENNSANSEYGTTMSLMLLPHWTDGCIASMEGLFFEATASTNYHFLTSAAISESASNPVRQLRYTNNDAELGVRHLRDLGVRYLMVRTEGGKAEAATNAAAGGGLEFITTSGTWDVYEVEGSQVVEALDVAPVVVDHLDGVPRYHPGDARERNLELGTSWFQRPEDWPAIPVDEGPDEWQRVSAEIVVADRIDDFDEVTGEPLFDDQSRKVDYVEPTSPIEPVALPEVAVSDVEIEQQAVRFSVDQVGVPVLVRVSYFPNWHVDGADGPFRAGPNHMIVVPTDTDVELTYDSRSALDWFFYLLTAVGIGLCVLWRRRGDVDVDGGSEDDATLPDHGQDRGDGGLTREPVAGSDDTDPMPSPGHGAEVGAGITRSGGARPDLGDRSDVSDGVTGSSLESREASPGPPLA